MEADILWAPWRMDYILGPKPDTCVFCLPDTTDEDRDRLILLRGRYTYILMNKFPYNSGHLMIVPYRHVSCLTDLCVEESQECMTLLQHATAVMKKAFNPGGINIGINIGSAAGAGIAAHLHFQLVPRWNGDSSFMAVFGQTRVVPELLLSTYDRIKPLFDTMSSSA